MMVAGTFGPTSSRAAPSRSAGTSEIIEVFSINKKGYIVYSERKLVTVEKILDVNLDDRDCFKAINNSWLLKDR